MTDLQDILQAIDRMNNNELDQVQEQINRRRYRPQTDDIDVQTKIARLHEALEHFWDGLSQEEIDAIVKDMNAEYIEPLDDDWLGDEDNP
jgi:hypothetical protein